MSAFTCRFSRPECRLGYPGVGRSLGSLAEALLGTDGSRATSVSARSYTADADARRTPQFPLAFVIPPSMVERVYIRRVRGEHCRIAEERGP